MLEQDRFLCTDVSSPNGCIMPTHESRADGKEHSHVIWEFPKMRGTLFWDPYNKDPTIRVLYQGPRIFENSHIM